MSTSEGYCEYLEKKIRQLEAVYAQFADLVKVIRCKDCAKCREKDMFGVATILECSRSGQATESDGWCKWAERRSDP